MEPTVEQVGDVTYYITPFPAFKAANLSGELAGVLAPLLGALAPLAGEKGGEGDVGAENKVGDESTSVSLMDVDVNKAAAALASVSGDKIESLMKHLLLGGHIKVEVDDPDGETEMTALDRDMANEIFCGEVQDMFILCYYVIRLNFNGFFKKFGTRSGKPGAAEKKKRMIL